MGSISVGQILVTPLDRIPLKGGDVLHAMKCTDPGFVDFGEAYYPSDIYHKMGEMFTIRTEVEKFVQTIQGIAHRLRQ